MRRKAGSCIFCGKGDLSKAHIFPDWLGRELGDWVGRHVEEIGVFKTFVPRMSVPVDSRRERQGHSGTRKVRKVCKAVIRDGWDRSREYARNLPILKPRTRTNYLGHIKVIRDHIGDDLYIDEVRKAHVAGFVSELRKTGLKTPTIRRYLATFSSVLTFAERSGWLSQNTVAQFDKRGLPEAQPRSRFLSLAEYRRLLAVVPPCLKPRAEISDFETGMTVRQSFSV